MPLNLIQWASNVIRSPCYASHLPLHVSIKDVTLGNVHSVPGHSKLQFIQKILGLLTLALTSWYTHTDTDTHTCIELKCQAPIPISCTSIIYLNFGDLPLTRALRMTVSSSELSCSGSWTVRRCPWSRIFWIWLAGWHSITPNTLHEPRNVKPGFSHTIMSWLSVRESMLHIGISPSSLISLIRSSHTNVEDKDENPTLASLTISPSVPHFSGNVQALWSTYLCMWQPPCCAQRSHQLDPVTDVCAVVGIWKGVQQQLVNAVRIPAAPIHQCDKDVSHASRACQDEPWCRIANAFVHPLWRETPCSDLQGETRPHMLQTSKPHIDRS